MNHNLSFSFGSNKNAILFNEINERIFYLISGLINGG